MTEFNRFDLQLGYVSLTSDCLLFVEEMNKNWNEKKVVSIINLEQKIAKGATHSNKDFSVTWTETFEINISIEIK